MVRFALHALATALGFWIAAQIVPGVHAGGWGSLIGAGVLLGIVNAMVRPILVILTFPLTVITLRLFLLVVNGLMVWLVTLFLKGIQVHGLWSAILAAIVISLTSWAASGVIGAASSVRRR